MIAARPRRAARARRAVWRSVGTSDDAEQDEFWTRLTVGYQKVGGRWRISHEHWSMPIDKDSGEALMALEPERKVIPAMTPSFRRIALGMEGAVERAHHGHPDFRVGGRIFATLGYPNRDCGTVMLTPDQQRSFAREHAPAFVAVKGAWGEQGSTTVRLDVADEEAVGEAITLAWQNAARKPPVRSRGAAARKPDSPVRGGSRKKTGRA